MGGLCGCCADEPPDTGNTMGDHKNAGVELEAMEDERQPFVQDGVAEFDLSSTGEMVLPTYPLKESFAKELRRQILEGRFKPKPKQQPQLDILLASELKDKLKKQLNQGIFRPKPTPAEEQSEPEEEEDGDEPDLKAAAVPIDERSEETEDEEEDEEEESDMEGADGTTVPAIIPLISPKLLDKPQVWGIYGDWKDLDDEDGRAAMSKYTQTCLSYSLDVDKDKMFDKIKEMEANGEQIVGVAWLNEEDDDEKKRGYGIVDNDNDCFEFCLDMPNARDRCQERPSYVVGEFGDGENWKGMYRFAPFREAVDFAFWRGNYATGVRGIIDPFDPDNPYGVKNASELSDFKKGELDAIRKNLSGVSQNQTAATLEGDLSKISSNSQIDITDRDIDIDGVDGYGGCLYQRVNIGPMGSILMTSSNHEIFQEVPTCPDGVYFDDAVQALQEYTAGSDLSKITWLKCHVNTWGLSANNWFADEMVSTMKSLTKFDLSDTVKFRHRSDLCMGIKSILMAAVDKNIQYIDMSNNFLDMDGGRAFAAFLAENKSLRILKVNNCSLGDKATEQMIEALTKNHALNLTEFHASGNDFCIEGMKQLIEIFEEMETLEVLDMSRCINPYKPHSGLKYLVKGLITNYRTLKYVDISHNTFNNDMEVVEQIQAMMKKCMNMKSLNISCLGMHKKACQAILQTFKECANDIWGLDQNLRQLIWNKDLRCSPSTALQFAEKELPNIYNLKLRHIELKGVFRKLENRTKIKRALKNIDITCVLDGAWDPEETEEVSNTEYPEQK